MRIFIVFTGIILALFSCSNGTVYPEAPFDGSRVLIDISELQDRVPVFYSFRHEGMDINYIILRIGNDVQSYFDACAECHPEKKGFRYEDGRLICNLCSVGYSIRKFREGEGTCYPLKLKGKLINNIYEIEKEDIVAGGKFF